MGVTPTVHAIWGIGILAIILGFQPSEVGSIPTCPSNHGRKAAKKFAIFVVFYLLIFFAETEKISWGYSVVVNTHGCLP